MIRHDTAASLHEHEVHEHEVECGSDESTEVEPEEDSARPRVGVLSGRGAVIDSIRQSCAPDFAVRVLDYEQIRDGQGPGGLDALPPEIGELSVVVVDWNVSASGWQPDLLSLVSEQTGVPVVALCDPRNADGVTALIAGADFAVRMPVNAAVLQAFQVAYWRISARDVKCGAISEEVLEIEIEERYAGDGSLGNSDSVAMQIESRAGKARGRAVLSFGPITLLPATREIVIDGEQTELSERPFELLRYLVLHEDECCTRARLLQEVWGYEFDPSTNVVDVQVYNLRSLLKAYGLDKMIRTVRGKGYVLQRPSV